MNRPVSIVIPAYNESVRIPPTLEVVDAYFRQRGADYEIIVVDDGSSDGTPDVVRRIMEKIPAIRLIENGVNRGKGYSVRAGFLAAKGGLVLFSDADLSTPIREFERLLAEIERGADIAVGSRALAESQIKVRQPIYRELMGKIFNRLVRFLTIGGFSDTQCGFKLFKAESCRSVFLAQKIERFAFDVELLFLASRMGLAIREVPVEWHNSPRSTVRLFQDSTRMFLDIVRIRFNYMTGTYRLKR